MSKVKSVSIIRECDFCNQRTLTPKFDDNAFEPNGAKVPGGWLQIRRHWYGDWVTIDVCNDCAKKGKAMELVDYSGVARGSVATRTMIKLGFKEQL